MAKKKVVEVTENAEVTPETKVESKPEVAVFSTPPVLLALDPDIVSLDPRFRDGKGEPSKADVDALATNMLELRERGLPHQIQPGCVVMGEDAYYVVAGLCRLRAEQKLNALKPDEPFLFNAIVVPLSEIHAVFLSVSENSQRTPANLFEQADAMTRLEASGMTHDAIGKLYRIARSTVGEVIRSGKLPKYIQKLYTGGRITKEGVIAAARYIDQPAVLESLVEDLKAAKESAFEVEKAAVEAAEGGESEESPTTGKMKGKAKVSEAVKGKKKPADKPAPISGADVKKAAAKKGLKKQDNSGSGSRSMKDLIVFLNGNFGDSAKDDVTDPMRDLAEIIEAWKDGEKSDLQLRNQWVKSCRTKYAG